MTSDRVRLHLNDTIAFLAVLVVIELGWVRARVLLMALPVAIVVFVLMRLRVPDPDRRPSVADIVIIGASVIAAVAIVAVAKVHAGVGVNVAAVLACTAVCHAVRLSRHERTGQTST